MIIDFHTHAFPDKLAERAVFSLAQVSGIEPRFDGTVAGLLENMDKNGVDKAVVLSVATKETQTESIAAFTFGTLESQPRLFPFASLHPFNKDIKKLVRSFSDKSVKGIKIHPDYLRIPVGDSAYDGIFAACAEYGMPVVIHAGYDCVSPDLIHAPPDGIAGVLDKFPGLILICAHFGGYMLWDEVAEKLCGRDVWFDTSLAAAGYGMTAAQAKRIIDSHDTNKILFGSDAPWCSASEVLEFLNALGLGTETTDKILYKNAEALLYR